MQAANLSSVETPTKSSGNNDRGLVKRSKGFDALEMSIGNGNVENAEGEADQSLSKRFVNQFLFLSALIIWKSLLDYNTPFACTYSHDRPP